MEKRKNEPIDMNLMEAATIVMLWGTSISGAVIGIFWLKVLEANHADLGFIPTFSLAMLASLITFKFTMALVGKLFAFVGMKMMEAGGHS